jgi:DNA polymerase III alpha subunit (gram-positive type)
MARRRKRARLQYSWIKTAGLSVTDVESTGLSPKHDRVVEIWIGKYHGRRRIEELSSLVNPNQEIPEEA